ncbi:MAG: substrate-binding domain-containing protein [Ruminiclostridium sp.]
MIKKIVSLVISLAMLGTLFTACGSSTPSQDSSAPIPTVSSVATDTASTSSVTTDASSATIDGVATTASLDNYAPKKTEYKFVFTYKLVHPWWDAVKVGMDAAIADYAKKGIKIDLDYNAPATPDAIDQINRLETAAGTKPDVIGVDVTEIKTVVPTINKIVAGGIPVMTFSSSDATKEQGCNRIAYVGNTHNKEDGATLAEALAKAINYEGEVAALAGTIGSPCHEDRIVGFKEVMAKYPKIKVVDIQNDNDDLEKSVQISENFIQKHPDLKGIFANNMTNPIGAAQAVEAAGKQGKIVIVGMDHDRRALDYLNKGTILALGVQDCFLMGFDSIQTAIKITDGEKPGGEWIKSETDNKKTTIIYKEQAQAMIDLLFGKK